MLISPWRLWRTGVIGMNCRNVRYISRYNPRSAYPVVDDKLRTKLLAEEHGITTPSLLRTVRSQFEVAGLAASLATQPGFAIKPAKGSGGKGILVITGSEGGQFIKASGRRVDKGDIERHTSNILSGLYSLAGVPDVAVVESLITFEEAFARYTHEGVPDIRVVLFRGYPVMAMMRLSTAASDGKANLHQGAVGVGLDIATGRAVRGVQYDRPCPVHPDTGESFAELAIPDWRALLELAAGCYEMTGLGYLGADMVLDREHGPMLLELNARPGLAIQMANGEGLLPRLRLVERQPDGRPVAERVALAQDTFARAPGPELL